MVTKVINQKLFRMEYEVYRGSKMIGKGFELRAFVKFKDSVLKAV